MEKVVSRVTPQEFMELRIKKGWKRQEAADLLGVNYDTVLRYEIGYRRIPLMAWRLLILLPNKQEVSAKVSAGNPTLEPVSPPFKMSKKARMPAPMAEKRARGRTRAK